MLRMLGFDTLYDNHFDDDEIVAIAERDGRIVLTRDRELLKRRAVTHGCYVHALKSEAQLREIVERLDLARSAFNLIGDAPLTGGGLWAFPGLFSQYIMVTPYFLYNYSHDLCLDVILEQGVVGGVALLTVFLLSGLALASRMGKATGKGLIATLSVATLASLIALAPCAAGSGL